MRMMDYYNKYVFFFFPSLQTTSDEHPHIRLGAQTVNPYFKPSSFAGALGCYIARALMVCSPLPKHLTSIQFLFSYRAGVPVPSFLSTPPRIILHPHPTIPLSIEHCLDDGKVKAEYAAVRMKMRSTERRWTVR